MNLQVISYDTESQTITIKLDTGGDFQLNMKDEYIAYYGPGCDIEMDFTADAAKDVYFSAGGSPITVLQIIQWAEKNHNAIHSETLEEERREDDYIRQNSCPYLSGRI